MRASPNPQAQSDAKFDIYQAKPKSITKVQQEVKDLHLARENQRELSNVSVARPQTMYY
jgi:hypothetical protein